MPSRGANATIDREVLIRLLYSRTDSRGVLLLHQQKLADELGVTKFTVSRIVHEYLQAGRMRKLSSGKGNISRYVIADPDEAAASAP